MKNLNKEINLPKSFIHWACNIICCVFFAYLLYHQIIQLKADFQVLDLTVALTYLILFFIVIFRPYAIDGRFDFFAVSICLISNFYYLFIDFKSVLITDFIVEGTVIFSTASVLWIFSILWLGNSFSILPALRGVKVNGPYFIIRHPIYFSYLLMDIGLILMFPSWRNLTIISIGIYTYLLRIKFEEKLLLKSEEYQKYTRKVKYKLIPFIF